MRCSRLNRYLSSSIGTDTKTDLHFLLARLRYILMDKWERSLKSSCSQRIQCHMCVSKGGPAGICAEQRVKKLTGFSRDQENDARSFEISTEDKKGKMSKYERIL